MYAHRTYYAIANTLLTQGKSKDVLCLVVSLRPIKDNLLSNVVMKVQARQGPDIPLGCFLVVQQKQWHLWSTWTYTLCSDVLEYIAQWNQLFPGLQSNPLSYKVNAIFFEQGIAFVCKILPLFSPIDITENKSKSATEFCIGIELVEDFFNLRVDNFDI